MEFVILALMAFAIFMERPSSRNSVDDGLFLPIDPKGLSSSYPLDGGGIDLNSHNF